jgi:hypothetical protein
LLYFLARGRAVLIFFLPLKDKKPKIHQNEHFNFPFRHKLDSFSLKRVAQKGATAAASKQVSQSVTYAETDFPPLIIAFTPITRFISDLSTSHREKV